MNRKCHLAAVAMASAIVFAGPARARTCTVDLDEVQVIRKEVLDLVKGGVRVDADRAGAVKRKYGDVLKGGSVQVDPNDFKGLFSMKGKPSPTLVKDLLARLQNIIASCQ